MFGRMHYFIIIVVLSLSGCGEAMGEDNKALDVLEYLSTLNIAYSEEGQLVIAWSWGRDRPVDRRLATIAGANSVYQVAAEGIRRVRWLSKMEVIAQQKLADASGGITSRLVKINALGEITEVVSAGEMLSIPNPSSDGRWIATTRYDEQGLQVLQVRDVADNLEVVAEYGESKIDFQLSDPVWSPDDSRLAATLRRPDAIGHSWPVLVVISRDDGRIERPFNNLLEDRREYRVRWPLFWTRDGIYATSDRGLLKCVPETGDCELVYSPGEDQRIVSGATGLGDEALLLVRDLQPDPLEIRSKEIHKVVLSTGIGEVLFRAPDNIFISSIDWVHR